MNCKCDKFQFPLTTSIAAGLTRLTRQTGTFAEFRRAMLHAASVPRVTALEDDPLWSSRYLLERDRNSVRASLDAIGQWRGRHPQDFGIMLLEMWAYVCDLTSFYDQVIANEGYVQTASRRASLRKLIAPLGYIPRPAVAALVELAGFAEGRQAVTLPVGTAFRSGAFKGNPPQVFEVSTETTIHPLLNEWSLLPVRPRYLEPQPFLLCRPGTVSVKVDDLVVVRVGFTPQLRRVTQIGDYAGLAGENYVRVSFDSPLSVPSGTLYSTIRLLKPSATASPWTLDVGTERSVDTNRVDLDSINRQIRKDQFVILEGGGLAGVMTVASNLDVSRTVRAEIPAPSGSTTISAVPAVTATVSRVTFTGGMNSTLAGGWPQLYLHYGLVEAGVVTAEAMSEIIETDPLMVRAPIELPRDSSPPGNFQLEDKNNVGLARPGTLNFANGVFHALGAPWPEALVTPVKLFGNLVTTSRGETVTGETLGSGDGAIANQNFTLKKSPLTYLPSPSEGTASGLTSTLKVYVDGLQWTEVPSFYRRSEQDEVYIVRENDKSEAIVTFGDGVSGRRLSTGSKVTANYRFGGGAAMPPPGSITQVAKPVKGLKGVRNPVAAYGGADAEPTDSLQKFAPRSALLLGRAVSLADLEAAAASYSGVRAVAAEWRWSSRLQLPAAHIWYLGNGDLTRLITNRLKNLTQPDTQIQVEPATAATQNLSIQLTVDPRRLEGDVLSAVRIALLDTESGLLPPERLGIGKPLFRSRVFEFLLKIPGVESVTALNLGPHPFNAYGIKPPPGCYFEFTLFLNGRSE